MRESDGVRQIVAADIGGTHARFALASIAGGEVVALDDPVTLKTGDHASLRTAWEEFAGHHGGQLPRELAMAFAGPVGGELLKLTNNPWVIRPALMGAKLGVERHLILNDFGAIAHAVARFDDDAFAPSVRSRRAVAARWRDQHRRSRHRARGRRAAPPRR